MTSPKPSPSETGSRCFARAPSPRSGRPTTSTRSRPTCSSPISSAPSPSGCCRPRWSKQAGRPASRSALGRCRCGARSPAGLVACVGSDVLLGLREEDVIEAGPDADPHRVTLPGVVRRVDFTGPYAAVTVELAAPAAARPGEPGPPADARARIRARFRAGSHPRSAQRVHLDIDATRAHVFDPSTGLALHHP